MLDEHEDAWFGMVIFIIAWCVFGILGLIPWSYGAPNYEWHMNQENAWEIWVLFVSLGAVAVGFFAYACKKWAS